MMYIIWRLVIAMINFIIIGFVPTILVIILSESYEIWKGFMYLPIVLSLFISGLHQKFTTEYLDTEYNIFEAMIFGYRDMFNYLKTFIS